MKNMSEEEFEDYIKPIRGEIWSFSGMTPPNGAVLIRSIAREKDTYFYYLDLDSNMYYESASGYAFKKKMRDIRMNNE